MRMVRRKYQPSARTRAMRESLFGPTMLPSIEELECRPEPSHEQVEASLQRAPILRRFRRLVEFLGDGRAVTTAGTVVLDDARALVPLLGTTDVIDPRLGDEVLPTRSAEWLPDLHATISLAKRTGVVRIHRGRLVSTKKGRAVDRHADDPVFAAAHAVVGIGPLQLCLGRRFGSPVQHWIDERSIHLLCDLHFAGGSVAFDDLVADWRERYDEVVDDLFISVRDELPEKRLDELRDCWSAAFFEHELEQALDVFELCGLLRRSGHATRMLLPDLAMREGGELSVTPFGEWFLWGVVLHAEAMAVVRADAAAIPGRRCRSGRRATSSACSTYCWGSSAAPGRRRWSRRSRRSGRCATRPSGASWSGVRRATERSTSSRRSVVRIPTPWLPRLLGRRRSSAGVRPGRPGRHERLPGVARRPGILTSTNR